MLGMILVLSYLQHQLYTNIVAFAWVDPCGTANITMEPWRELQTSHFKTAASPWMQGSGTSSVSRHTHSRHAMRRYT